MEDYTDEKIEEILGITRCAQCGHRLEGEVECPFCAVMRGYDSPVPEGMAREHHGMSLWVYLTAMLMTFPLSLPWLLMSRRLTAAQKAATLAVGVIWSVTVIWFI